MVPLFFTCKLDEVLLCLSHVEDLKKLKKIYLLHKHSENIRTINLCKYGLIG